MDYRIAVQNKFFTPPLTEQDRLDFARTLGFDRFDFLYVERLPDMVLVAKQFVEGRATDPILHPVAMVDNLLETSPIPVFVVNWKRTELPVVDLSAGPSPLWEELFPFPLCHLFRYLDEVQVSDEALRSALFKVKNAVQRFESRISAYEATFLDLKSEIGDFPLLFHHVRNRRVRVGTSPDLALWSTETQLLPLRSLHLALNLDDYAGLLPLEGIAQLFQALTTADSASQPESLSLNLPAEPLGVPYPELDSGL